MNILEKLRSAIKAWPWFVNRAPVEMDTSWADHPFFDELDETERRHKNIGLALIASQILALDGMIARAKRNKKAWRPIAVRRQRLCELREKIEGNR